MTAAALVGRVDRGSTPTRDDSGFGLLMRIARKERAGLVAGTLAGLVWMAARVAVPKLTQLAIDRGIAPGSDPLAIEASLFNLERGLS